MNLGRRRHRPCARARRQHLRHAPHRRSSGRIVSGCCWSGDGPGHAAPSPAANDATRDAHAGPMTYDRRGMACPVAPHRHGSARAALSEAAG